VGELSLPPAVYAPQFPRLSEYFGLWAVEWAAWESLWRTHAVTDLFLHAAAGPARGLATTTEMVPVKGGKTVAVVNAAGMLMKQQPSMGGTSTAQLRRDIRSAANDPNVSGILLRVDSPGGTVAGTSDLAADVKAARRKKPVWGHVDDLAASAAYWMLSQADAVYANSPTALVGSIGTLHVVYDSSAAAEREGVKVLRFATGPLKGAGAPGVPVTEEMAADYQRIVNETQTHFDAAVRTGRGLTANQLDAVRTGGVFPAAEAVERKLIDGVRSFDATLAALSEAR
jgi:signal peptide peptidase SppA